MPLIFSPGVSAGRWNIVNPSCFDPVRSVRATNRMFSAKCALEHHVFCPLISQPPDTFSALQLRFPTSEPASGSDIEIDSDAPRTMPPSTVSFWASVPNLAYAAPVMSVGPTPPIGAIPRAACSSRMHMSTAVPAEPPYSSGTVMPSQPRSAIFR